MRHYAGVGSRKTPNDILATMEAAAEALDHLGWTLRSGHAPGADQAFERGAGRHAEVYLPWPSFEYHGWVGDLEADYILDRPTMAAYDVAAQVHPAWDKLKPGARHLHARNAHQVLGADLRTPVRFLLCWTPGGKVIGGTATAIRIAHRNGIDVRNLADGPTLWRVERMIETVLGTMR